MAHVGAILSVYHVVAVCTVFPGLESVIPSADSVPVNVAFLVLIPTVNWAIIVFTLLTFQRLLKTRGQKTLAG